MENGRKGFFSTKRLKKTLEEKEMEFLSYVTKLIKNEELEISNAWMDAENETNANMNSDQRVYTNLVPQAKGNETEEQSY